MVRPESFNVPAPPAAEPVAPPTIPLTEAEAKKATLLTYLEGGNMSAAARAAGVDPSTIRNWWRADPDYKIAWEYAREAIADALEESCLRRALAGDTILTIFMLKALRPEKFRETVRIEQVNALAEQIAAKYGVSVDELLDEADAITAKRVGPRKMISATATVDG